MNGGQDSRGPAVDLDRLVTSLIPSLSRSLAEEFNVFRVMHHGTHEKQLSNVFAWLLRADATHGLEDSFQRLFVDEINSHLSADALPTTGYSVQQEVDTSGPEGTGRDIADIVLNGDRVCLVVENFESSDGHGHDYHRYLAHGASAGRRSIVVLLCARAEPNRQSDGWEDAVVVTYADVIRPLRAYLDGEVRWRATHATQHMFIDQMFQHFVEGTSPVSDDDRIAFIKAMCETGESVRYGQVPHQRAAEEFATLLAQHAERQFEEGRTTLSQVKRALRQFAERTLVEQVNSHSSAIITSVQARFVGQWEWCVTLRRGETPPVYLEFGPTAVVENGRVGEPLLDPDYSKVFVTRQASGQDATDRIIQTAVSLGEVLDGLAPDDVRLRDAILAILA